MRRRRRSSYRPVVSAFLAGLLAAIGLDPGGVLVESAIQAALPYLQFAAWALLLILALYTIYATVGSFAKYLRAFEARGVLGLLGVLAAVGSGYLALSRPSDAVLLLAAAIVAWALGRYVR